MPGLSKSVSSQLQRKDSVQDILLVSKGLELDFFDVHHDGEGDRV